MLLFTRNKCICVPLVSVIRISVHDPLPPTEIRPDHPPLHINLTIGGTDNNNVTMGDQPVLPKVHVAKQQSFANSSTLPPPMEVINSACYLDHVGMVGGGECP